MTDRKALADDNDRLLTHAFNVLLMVEHGCDEAFAQQIVTQWDKKCAELAALRSSGTREEVAALVRSVKATEQYEGAYVSHEEAYRVADTILSLPAPAENQPVAWTIPGDDTADANGFMPTKCYREGEFTKPLYAEPPPAPAGVREALESIADWCATQRAEIGAIDGYDYHSGEEYGLRCAEIEITKRLSALPQQSAGVRAAAKRLRDMLVADGDPPALNVPSGVDANEFTEAFDALSAALALPQQSGSDGT